LCAHEWMEPEWLLLVRKALACGLVVRQSGQQL
jgi:hypothetical protein